MRMEEEYRRRLHQVSNTIKRRLDYQVDVEQTQRKFEQKHMVQWLENAVTQLVKGKQVRKIVVTGDFIGSWSFVVVFMLVMTIG